MARKRVAVVGAGVVGLAIACKLQQSGCAVLLIDRDEPGRQCSYGNAGHIATEQVAPLASLATLRQALPLMLRRDGPLSVHPQYAHRILPWLMRFVIASRPKSFARGTSALAALNGQALAATRRLLQGAGIESLLHERGHLLLAESATAAAALADSQAFLQQHGVATEWLTPRRVPGMLPGVTPAIAGALYFPDTAHVSDPYGVCKGLLAAFQSNGGEFLRQDVRQITPQASGGFSLACKDREVICDAVIIAAGAWSGDLAGQLGHRVPLDTERGYHLTVNGSHCDWSMPVASLDRRVIATPLEQGLRITGFVEFAGLDLPPKASRYDVLQRHLQALLPQASLPAAERWMGFRPSLPDHLPVIDRSRAFPSALFAFGHQHLGLTLAGITAELIEAMLFERPLPLDISAFACNRFRKRHLL